MTTSLVDKLDLVIASLAGLKSEVTNVTEDMRTVKDILGRHGMQLRSLQADVTVLKNGYRTTQKDVNALKLSYGDQANEVRKLGVLLEDLEDRFQAAGEI